MMSALTGVCALLLMFYVGAAGYTYFNQDWIIFARGYEKPAKTVADMEGAVSYQVRMQDGTLLDGLHLPPQTGLAAKAPVVLIYSGNSQDVFTIAQHVHHVLPAYDVVGVNYRGYGYSEGLPSEKAILADAVSVLDHVQAHFANRPVVLYGQSLGSSVAAYVASQRRVAGTMLLTPFDSMEALGQAKYPWLPVSLLVKHRFNSVAFVKGIQDPVSVLIALQDKTVPEAHSSRLIAALPFPPYKATVPSEHSRLHLQEGYEAYLKGSLAYFTESQPE